MKKIITLMLTSALLLSSVPAFAENEPAAADGITIIDNTEETAPAADGITIIDNTEGAAPAADGAAEITVTPAPEPAAEPEQNTAGSESNAGITAVEEAPAPVAEYHAPKELIISYNGTPISFDSVAYIDDNGIAMVPIKQLAELIGFKVSYNTQYNTEDLSLGDNHIYFDLFSTFTTAFGYSFYSLAPTIMWGDKVYVSLRTFADSIGSELDVTDYGDVMTINMHSSTFVNDYLRSLPVNQWGIASKTGYMVWVSLSEYTVRLYEGSQYAWKPIHECKCAIGAPGTPTVTGSFEYKYKTRWNYNGYYVGPCLVFYRGYALHSVLLKYNNTEYDGRTGVKISHGCVRMKKPDIDLIANTIPVGTRIYITP